MEALQATPGQPDTVPCPRLPMLSATNQGLVADYLAYLSARQYAPSVQEGTLRARPASLTAAASRAPRIGVTAPAAPACSHSRPQRAPALRWRVRRRGRRRSDDRAAAAPWRRRPRRVA